MSTPLPFTISGRSPVDGIRLRWGGCGSVLFGVALCVEATPVAVFFGLVLIALGVTTLAVTRFGSISWLELSTPLRTLSAIGAVVGVLFVLALCSCFIVTYWFIQLLLKSTT